MVRSWGTYATLAQLVEQLTRNEQVWGSSPQGGSRIRYKRGVVIRSVLFYTHVSCLP